MKEQLKSDILLLGIQTISKEIEALNLLKESMDDQFTKIVSLLDNSDGRIIISGIGKSALVATKIVATMNSTGTAAIFMHAADAAHGDLGMVQKEDVLLSISKSGETEELTFIQSMVKQFGNTTIAMTANKSSQLAMEADCILFTPIQEEADPNNLAPTSSSTVQMAMGDALAISLSELKGFTDKHFAKYHPGGALGRQLYLTVDNLTNKNVFPSVFENDNLRTIIVEMTSKRLGATLVLSKEEKVIGIITDGDLRRMLDRNENTDAIDAQHIMTKNPKGISKTLLAAEALKVMRAHSINHLLVMDENKCVGLIHIHDILSKGV